MQKTESWVGKWSRVAKQNSAWINYNLITNETKYKNQLHVKRYNSIFLPVINEWNLDAMKMGKTLRSIHSFGGIFISPLICIRNEGAWKEN